MSWHKLGIERRLDFQFLKKKQFQESWIQEDSISNSPAQWSWREQGALAHWAAWCPARAVRQRMCAHTPGNILAFHFLLQQLWQFSMFNKGQRCQKFEEVATCRGVILADGVYSNNRDTRSMASGEVRARNTFKTDIGTSPQNWPKLTFGQGWALIWGNLNSV